MTDQTAAPTPVHQPLAHDSAIKHVTGRATYTDDIAGPAGTPHAWLACATETHARIRKMDLAAVRAAPGVIGVLTAADSPGANDISPTGRNDEPVFPTTLVEYHGQPLFAVVAETRDAARRAAALARIDYEVLPHALDPVSTQEAGYPVVTDPLTLTRGDADTVLADAPHRITGRMEIGGQDHMYLEGQIAFAIPGEDEEVSVHCSTQHPSEAQHMVAHVLGGGFDDEGRIMGVSGTFAARCGYSADLSGPVTDRAFSMPTTPISTPMCTCKACRKRPTPSPTPRFEGSAARRA